MTLTLINSSWVWPTVRRRDSNICGCGLTFRGCYSTVHGCTKTLKRLPHNANPRCAMSPPPPPRVRLVRTKPPSGTSHEMGHILKVSMERRNTGYMSSYATLLHNRFIKEAGSAKMKPLPRPILQPHLRLKGSEPSSTLAGPCCAWSLIRKRHLEMRCIRVHSDGFNVAIAVCLCHVRACNTELSSEKCRLLRRCKSRRQQPWNPSTRRWRFARWGVGTIESVLKNVTSSFDWVGLKACVANLFNPLQIPLPPPLSVNIKRPSHAHGTVHELGVSCNRLARWPGTTGMARWLSYTWHSRWLSLP